MKHYLELIWVFTWREIKGKYWASVLGPAWVIVHPALLTGVTTLVFSQVLHVNTDPLPYIVFVLTGIIPWYFFSYSVNQAAQSLPWNRDLVTKAVFPKEVLPIAYTLARVIDFLVRSFALLLIIVYLDIRLAGSAVLVPFVFFFQMIFTLGCSLFFAAANAMYRDISYVLEAVFLLWFFLTPVVYPETMIPPRYSYLLTLNPIANAIRMYRSLLYYGIQPPIIDFAWLIGMSVTVFLTGIWYFRRNEHKFSDTI